MGTTRGIHAEPWDELHVSVATGRIFGAWVDLRAGESFGKVVTVGWARTPQSSCLRGVGNSFQTLEEEHRLHHLVNDHWSADAVSGYSFLNLADETVASTGPSTWRRQTLQRDRNHPRLNRSSPWKPTDPDHYAGGQLGTELVRPAHRAERCPSWLWIATASTWASPSGGATHSVGAPSARSLTL